MYLTSTQTATSGNGGYASRNVIGANGATEFYVAPYSDGRYAGYNGLVMVGGDHYHYYFKPQNQTSGVV